MSENRGFPDPGLSFGHVAAAEGAASEPPGPNCEQVPVPPGPAQAGGRPGQSACASLLEATPANYVKTRLRRFIPL